MTDNSENTPETNTAKTLAKKIDKEFIKTRLKELWNGEIPLCQCFWLYYFSAVLIVSVIGGLIGGILYGLLNIIALGWSGFMVMPVIRSSEKYKGDKNWALAAKIAAILIALTTAANLITILTP